MGAERTRASGFDSRVEARRLDLIERIRNGVPPIEYLPASDGMLVQGKRHLIVAPKKTGKSLSTLVHLVDMVMAGATVSVFDRENGGDLYARRLQGIIEARELDDDQQNLLARHLVYYEFPRLRSGDEDELVALLAGTDLVVFDSQRMFLSDLGLGEDKSDEYADFMAALIDPLFRAEVATLILDNSGHGEPKRSRGSSSKGDLNEILFSLSLVADFDLDTTGRLQLEITDSRFGNVGSWEMTIGGGEFGAWQRAERATEAPRSGFRPTTYMERVSRHLEERGEVPRSKIEAEIGGNASAVRTAIDLLLDEGFARERIGKHGARLTESVRPYRQAKDPLSDRYEPEDGVPATHSATDLAAGDDQAEAERLEAKHADLFDVEEVF